MFLDIIHRLVHLKKKNNFSETGFCLRPQVKPTQLDPIDRASPYLQTPMSVTQEDNIQKHNTCNNIPSSQTFRSYLHNQYGTGIYLNFRKFERLKIQLA
jgi:hypothetical protein